VISVLSASNNNTCAKYVWKAKSKFKVFCCEYLKTCNLYCRISTNAAAKTTVLVSRIIVTRTSFWCYSRFYSSASGKVHDSRHILIYSIVTGKCKLPKWLFISIFSESMQHLQLMKCGDFASFSLSFFAMYHHHHRSRYRPLTACSGLEFNFWTLWNYLDIW